MRSIRIIPTVLANTKEEFDERLAKLLPVTKELQIDMMDGHFVPSTGVPPEDLPDLHRWAAWTFEAHMMVYHPERYIDELAEKGFKRVIFHYEAVEDKRIPDFAQHIRDAGMAPIMALNPETPVRRVVKYASRVDGVLFLGVHPGFNGAPYVEETPARIAELVELTGGKDTERGFFIQVDGGMTPETIGGAVAAGADRINSGSFVSKADDPAAAMRQLRDAADAALNQAAAPDITLNKKTSSGKAAAERPNRPKRPAAKRPAKKTSKKKTSRSRGGR